MTLLDFDDAATGGLPAGTYESAGALFYGAAIFHVPIGSWASARSGSQGFFPAVTASHDGTTFDSIRIEHAMPASNAGGAVADVYFVSPGTTLPAAIDGFSIGFGYDSDGGETNQAVIIEAFNSADERILNVIIPGLYYDGYESFIAPGAVRLRLSQNGYVGFDDLSFDPPTLLGDANFDGRVDGDDFAIIDRGRAQGLSGWSNGDFTRNGVIDEQDYAAIDQSYAAAHGPATAALLAERSSQFGTPYAAWLASLPEPSCLPWVLIPAFHLERRRPRPQQRRTRLGRVPRD